MAYITTRSRVVYIKEETTQGVAVEPALGSDAVAILADGFELNGEKELVERNVLTSSIAAQIPRTGIKTATGSIGVEWKANGTAGATTEYGLLFESLLGAKRALASTVTTKATGNTTNVLAIEDTDISKFNVGDIIMVKEAGAFHVSPILSRVVTPGSATITLLRPKATAFSNSVVIEKVQNYYGANNGHKYLTITSFLDKTFKQQATGCLVNSISVDNFSVGQIPTLSFGLEGINYTDSVVQTAGYSHSAGTPSTNISAGTDDSFDIAVDGLAAVTVSLTVAGLTSGALIAAEMQTKINAALTGASVTVVFADGIYKITSDKMGDGSSVIVTDATLDNVADDLKIGVANSGSEVVGVSGNGLTPAYDAALPPICLSACIYMDGVAIPCTDVAVSVESTVGRITSTCSPNGIISTRATQRATSGSLTTYAETDSVSYYNKFDTNAEFSLFAYAGIPTATAGEMKDVVAFYVPRAIITAKPMADADGIGTYAIEFQAGYSETAQTDVVFATV